MYLFNEIKFLQKFLFEVFQLLKDLISKSTLSKRIKLPFLEFLKIKINKKNSINRKNNFYSSFLTNNRSEYSESINFNTALRKLSTFPFISSK